MHSSKKPRDTVRCASWVWPVPPRVADDRAMRSSAAGRRTIRFSKSARRTAFCTRRIVCDPRSALQTRRRRPRRNRRASICTIRTPRLRSRPLVGIDLLERISVQRREMAGQSVRSRVGQNVQEPDHVRVRRQRCRCAATSACRCSAGRRCGRRCRPVRAQVRRCWRWQRRRVVRHGRLAHHLLPGAEIVDAQVRVLRFRFAHRRVRRFAVVMTR